jgi:ribosomal-protein-alanine N-acetyltransferase
VGGRDQSETLAGLALCPAGPVDVPEIAGLAARALGGAWSERGFADQASKRGAVLWTARAGPRSELLGYLVGERVLEELHVLSVGVEPARRRQGIGRSLVARALAAASSAGVDVVHLELRESNRAARCLYEGFGFVEVGRRPRYYRCRERHEDAVLMTLVLRAPIHV